MPQLIANTAWWVARTDFTGQRLENQEISIAISSMCRIATSTTSTPAKTRNFDDRHPRKNGTWLLP